MDRDGLGGAGKLPWSLIWSRYYVWAAVLMSGVLIVTCYGFALGLPFFSDDMPVLAWAGGRSLVDVWTRSNENSYYRPLSFTVYKLARTLPSGTQQVVLHGMNLLIHWLNATLVMLVTQLLQRSRPTPLRAVLAALLYAVFPFLYRAIPWVTALPHFLVVLLTLLAAYSALRAEREGKAAWWVLSLAATALAPLAHESGLVCGVIVGGLVVIEHGVLSDWRRVVWVVLGGLCNVGVFWFRSQLPGTGAFNPDGLNSWVENVSFLLQVLVYPVGRVMGWLVHQRGWHDLAVVQAASAGLAGLLVWLVVRTRDWRWVARALWWCIGLLPALVRFRYLGLINSPRFYALCAVGVVILWAEIIVELGRVVRPGWRRRLIWGFLAAAIVGSNLSYLLAQRQVHLSLLSVYRQILAVAQDERNESLGFVNVPAWLAPRDQTYPLSKDGVVVLPLYTNVWQFIAVNQVQRRADNVMFVHTLDEPEGYYFGFHGDWPDWDQMRQFAMLHRTVWLTKYESGRFVLHNVGSIRNGGPGPVETPSIRFEDGPVIESVSVQEIGDGKWALVLDWRAFGPMDANTFVHAVDRNGVLVTQADGPALGGMVPMSIWQADDLIHDIRQLALPAEGEPYSILVGVYDTRERVPVYVDGVRAPDDAAPVATIGH